MYVKKKTAEKMQATMYTSFSKILKLQNWELTQGTNYFFRIFSVLILVRLLNPASDFNLRLITDKVFVSKQIKNVRIRTCL